MLAPAATAQAPADEPPAYAILSLTAEPGNQRVLLDWDVHTPSGKPTRYVVYVYADGGALFNQTVENATTATIFLTNARTYVFEVAAIKPDGTGEGPRSDPVAATPQLENDLAYLAAGLIAVWLGLLGYAAFLARKEAAIDKKLERILQARFEGKTP